jgi:hypothetical protein
MPRFLTIRTDDDKTFKVHVHQPDSSRPVLKTDDHGFCRVNGEDGQVVLVHRSRIAWVHVKDEN